jgi:hypothetical protein
VHDVDPGGDEEAERGEDGDDAPPRRGGPREPEVKREDREQDDRGADRSERRDVVREGGAAQHAEPHEISELLRRLEEALERDGEEEADEDRGADQPHAQPPHAAEALLIRCEQLAAPEREQERNRDPEKTRRWWES